jgi:hypothetical protein
MATPAMVDVLKRDVAERADVIVDMNSPGVWIFASTEDDDRNMGTGVIIEYENRRNEPQWVPPPKAVWDYTAFRSNHVGVVIARHKRAGRIEQRDGKLCATGTPSQNGHLYWQARTNAASISARKYRVCVSPVGAARDAGRPNQ